MKNSMFELRQRELQAEPRTWVVTGAAGFIGSNLVEALIRLGQRVVGVDNFSTGHKSNLTQVRGFFPEKFDSLFDFIEGDISEAKVCQEACKSASIVLHQAALGSVPRSIERPIQSAEANIMGFMNMLYAAKENKVDRFVYASSSSVYGDHPDLPKKEENTGNLLSPYAFTKYVNELNAKVFHRTYGVDCIGLRYFNVFGARQDPSGAYAAVIPLWIKNLMEKKEVYINGDGETSRDFCYVQNVVQANILAGTATSQDALNRVYNVSCGHQTSLNKLYELLRQALAKEDPNILSQKPRYRDFRAGDVRHSLADVSLIEGKLGYLSEFQIEQGISLSIDWYRKNLKV